MSGPGAIDMRGWRRDGWRVVGRGPPDPRGATWLLRHQDGRERVALGVHLRALEPVSARRRPGPRPRTPRSPAIVAGQVVGTVTVLRREPGGGAVVTRACGHETRVTMACLYVILHAARRGRVQRCWACHIQRMVRYRTPTCRWCPRPRRRNRGECCACEKAAGRNGRHTCCRAPVRYAKTGDPRTGVARVQAPHVCL